jgi:NADPH:quinone reductase-like Zn-dependent oxidoreductase
MAMMKAAVIRTAGGPEVLKIESLPIPEPRNDHVLIRVKAFGLNRSELFTRYVRAFDALSYFWVWWLHSQRLQSS